MRRIVLFVCLLSAYSLGQGGAATEIPTITNTRGEPVPYATVAVCVGYPGAVPSTPCGTSTLATIDTDLTLTKSCTNNLTPPGPISGAGCSNPGKSDGLGNIIAFAVPGLYWCQYSGGSIIQPVVVPCFFANGSGGGIPFACASAVNGSIVGMTSPTTSSCDPNGITDFIGHWTSQSYRATGTHNGTVELTGGLADPTNPPDTNSVAFLAPLTVPTPYYVRPPASAGTVGQLLNLATQVTSTNGTIDALGWLNAVTTINGTACSLGSSCSITVGGTVEFQTNSVDNLNCTAGACPLQNIVSGTNTTVTNISGGNVRIDATGGLPTTQISTPTAPTLTTNGTPGATSRTYAIVGCEDVGCVYHTPASSTTTIATTNATLSSSNSVNLSAYGDTLYGPRCFNVYRTASAGTPSTTGLIAACVGKKFIDTGLAGDGTTAPVTNTTILTINMSPNPGCNIPPNGIIGVDAPPCSTNALDDEMGATFGTPADANSPFWTILNSGSGATSWAWSGGAIIQTNPLDAGNATGDFRSLYLTAPSTPYTFVAYVSQNSWTSFNECGIGFEESATNKYLNLTLINYSTAMGVNVASWLGSPPTSHSDIKNQVPASPSGGAYLKIQNTGTNLVFSFSTTGDGIGYEPFYSESKTSHFTTGPDRIVIGGVGLSTSAGPVCDFDYVRRTQ